MDVEKKREKRKEPGTNFGGNQASLKVSEGRASEGQPALAQRETPKRQIWQEPIGQPRCGAGQANQGRTILALDQSGLRSACEWGFYE